MMTSLTHLATSVGSLSTSLSHGWPIRVARSGRSFGFFLRQMSTKFCISGENTRDGNLDDESFLIVMMICVDTHLGGGWFTMYSSSSKMAMGLTLPAAELVAGVRGVRGVRGLGTGIMLAGSCACVVSISGQQSIICVMSPL